MPSQRGKCEIYNYGTAEFESKVSCKCEKYYTEKMEPRVRSQGEAKLEGLEGKP
jgi:hypothetical protein